MTPHIYGYHAIEEILRKRKDRGTLLVAKNNDRVTKLIDMAKELGLPVSMVDDQELDRYCGKKKHKGVIFLPEFKRKVEPEEGDYKNMIRAIDSENALVILLDCVTDPHNYGAILRSADQFQVNLVVTTERRAARETDTVASTSAGANVYVKKVVVTNLIQVMEFLKENGFWIYGADMNGKAAHETNLKGKTAIVMGSEGKGLRRLVGETCDALIKIPAAGHVDSFNVSVAAGILMYEAKRQQGF